MVSISVIGVLAAIAVPLYSKFHAKSRQIEAKASLANLFAAERNFFIQFNMYTVNLNNAGFGALGKGLRYATGFDVNGMGVPCVGYANGEATAPPEGVEAGSPKFVWNCDEFVNKEQTFELSAEWKMTGIYCKAQPKLPLGTSTTCDDTSGQVSFRAAAVGDPHNKLGPQSVDGWTIDEKKVIVNSSPGI